MIFGRKKKSASREALSRNKADGVTRRGQVAAVGRLPFERVQTRPKIEGANPYNSTGRAAKRITTGQKACANQSGSRYGGPNNPYDNAGPVPAKKKKLTWDDAVIGISKGR